MTDLTTPLRISVIIPTLNSPILDEVLRAVLQQEDLKEHDEIIVVGKDEPGLLQPSGHVRFIDTGGPVIASIARNIGIEAATGDLLLFLDSDCIAKPGWLGAHRVAHELGHAVVGGAVLPSGDGYWHLVYNLTMFHEVFSTVPPGPRPLLPTLNLSIDREVIDQVGGLDIALKHSHDMEWTTRMRVAGYEPIFWPAAVVEHRHNRTSFQQVWQDASRRGHYARQVRLQHKEALDTPSFLQSRQLTLALSPLIAGYVTARIVARRPQTMLHHPATWPAIYLTKIAWCWGASRP
jgi:GT2 family glycosyltransferase